MPLNPESKYPSRRTYGLKMRNDADRNALGSRVENVCTTGRHSCPPNSRIDSYERQFVLKYGRSP